MASRWASLLGCNAAIMCIAVAELAVCEASQDSVYRSERHSLMTSRSERTVPAGPSQSGIGLRQTGAAKRLKQASGWHVVAINDPTTTRERVHVIKKTARVAGVLYLLLVLFGLFNLIYVPGKLIVRGKAAETAQNLLAHQTLFRIDLVIGLLSSVVFIFLVLVLYRLFKDVNQPHATLMVILVLVQIPQSYVNQLLQIGAFELVRGADYLSVFDKSQREVLAILCFRLNDLGTYFSEAFWGLWLFPLGLLVYRSDFLPRTLGVWLIVNGFAYVGMSLTGLLFPEHAGAVYKIAFPALLGEAAFMLWLLIAGVKPKPLIDQMQASASG